MTSTSTSLLQRLRDRNDNVAWTRLTHLYTPLIRAWLGRKLPQSADVDDVSQQVFTVVVKQYPDFQHNGRSGAFRAWLRGICVNRVRMLADAPPANPGNPDEELRQLEDPNSDLTQQWDREHDAFIFRRALDLIEPEFESATWQAFRRVALDGAQPEVVAVELGLTINAIYIAKFRVLRRLREEIEGLV